MLTPSLLTESKDCWIKASLHGGVLRDRRLQSLLALNQLIHAGLQLDNFARYGAGRRGAEQQSAAKRSCERGCT